MKALAKAESANTIATSVLVPPTWKQKWLHSAFSLSVYASAKLDGNSLEQDQVETIVQKEPARDEHAAYFAARVGIEEETEKIQEVINLYHAYKYIDEFGKSKLMDVDTKLLLNLQALITERTLPLSQVGVWRDQKLVVRDEVDGKTIFSPPNPVEIEYQIKDLLAWINSTSTKEIPVLFTAAIIWAELARIYPFANANGRVTRLLVRYVLQNNGFSLVRYLPYEAYFIDNKAAYYQTLVETIKTHDFSGWIGFYVSSWAKQAEIFLTQLESADNRVTLSSLYQPISLTERQIAILDYFRRSGWVSLIETHDLFPKLSSDSVLRDIKVLIKKGMVKKKGTTKASLYHLKHGAW